MDVKHRSGLYIRFLVYLIVVVLVNAAGITLFFRMDLTKDRIYSISEVSRQVVSTLSEPLTVKVFFTKNLPAPHNTTERYLKDLLEEYSINANQYFNYSFYDVSPEEGDITQEAMENRELAQSYGITPVQIQHIEEDEIKFKRAYMGLVLLHGDLIERIPSILSTDRLEYRLTMAIQKLNNKISALLALPDKIRVKLFLSSSLNEVRSVLRLDTLPQVPGRLEDIVEKLNKKVYGRLAFEYLDPTQDRNLEEEAERYEILNLKWPALSDGKIKPGQGAIGLVMEYGEKVVKLPLLHVVRVPLIGTQYRLADLDKMEDVINEQVESLININEDIGYLSSNRTLRLLPPVPRGGAMRKDAVSKFRTLISQNYNLKNVNLKEEVIPEGLNTLIIARPAETFTDYELFQIDQFLMKGKSLALFMGAFEEEMKPDRDQPLYVPLSTGLEKLLEHYGIRIKKSYVMDENCYVQKMPQEMGGGEQSIYHAPMIKSQFINKDLNFIKNIKGLIANKISPLELIPERLSENGLQAHKLFASSERSWEMSEEINFNPMLEMISGRSAERESLALAYLLEGEFPSYFAGKPMPVKESGEGDHKTKNKDKDKSAEKGAKESKKGAVEDKDTQSQADEKVDESLAKIESSIPILSKGKPGKIFLIASWEMLKDYMLDTEGVHTNSMFILNILDYLNDREETAIMRAKTQLFNPLHETEAGTKVFVKFFNIAGLPVLVILFGLLVWFRRHSRKKRIQMMFQKEGSS
jgi:ABC-2 type transport system permease protein